MVFLFPVDLFFLHLETAMEVDITRLQILNDRIAQTIDALSHLRATTAGLSHAGGYGWSGVPGMSPSPWASSPYNAWNTPFGVPQAGMSPMLGIGHGLGHAADPYAMMNQINPWLNVPHATPFGMMGAGYHPYAAGLPGLSHTSPVDARMMPGIDPRFALAPGIDPRFGVGPGVDPRFTSPGWGQSWGVGMRPVTPFSPFGY